VFHLHSQLLGCEPFSFRKKKRKTILSSHSLRASSAHTDTDTHKHTHHPLAHTHTHTQDIPHVDDLERDAVRVSLLQLPWEIAVAQISNHHARSRLGVRPERTGEKHKPVGKQSDWYSVRCLKAANGGKRREKRERE
jgi:hypothetical protein